MKITGFDHIQLAMPKGGEDVARNFYVDILNLREVPKPANLSKSGCWFESDEVKLHLGVDPEFSPALKAHPALLVGDLDEAARHLAERGCAVRFDRPVPGYKRFFTEDPFGNRIEIMQLSDAS